MQSVEDWAEIRRLHFAEGLGIKTIAKRLGVARNTVRIAVRSGQPPAYRRPRRPSAVDPYEDQIRALLKDCPTMPATVIAERIGWRRGITILKQRVAELRPVYRPQDPPTIDPGSCRSGTCGSRWSKSRSATDTPLASRSSWACLAIRASRSHA